MSKGRTDFRTLKARRDIALARPELLLTSPKPTIDQAAVAAAIASGRLVKLPPKRPRR